MGPGGRVGVFVCAYKSERKLIRLPVDTLS